MGYTTERLGAADTAPAAHLQLHRRSQHAVRARRQGTRGLAPLAPAAAVVWPPARVLVPQRLGRLQVALPHH